MSTAPALVEVEEDPVEDLPIVPLPLARAVSAARDALEAADDLCRWHGDVPPSKPGAWTGSCETCEQPARVRKALTLLRNAAGEPPPPRRYWVDTDAPPCRVSGLYPVVGVSGRTVRGLFAPADEHQARLVIARELEMRGEVGPFDLVVTIGTGGA